MSSSHSTSKSKEITERRVYVTAYSSKEQSEQMRALFEKYGKIEEFSWKGRFFFVAYNNGEEASAAVQAMNKYNLNDHTLLVEFARSKKNNGACYQCGKVGHFARNCRFRKSSSSESRSRRKQSKKKKNRKRSYSSNSSQSSSESRKKKKSHRRKKSSSSSRSRSRSSS